MNRRAGISVKEPTSLAEREQVATRACTELKPGWPGLVDDVQNTVPLLSRMRRGLIGRQRHSVLPDWSKL